MSDDVIWPESEGWRQIWLQIWILHIRITIWNFCNFSKWINDWGDIEVYSQTYLDHSLQTWFVKAMCAESPNMLYIIWKLIKFATKWQKPIFDFRLKKLNFEWKSVRKWSKNRFYANFGHFLKSKLKVDFILRISIVDLASLPEDLILKLKFEN